MLALQALVLQLLQPFFSAAEVRRKKAEEAEQAAADAAARKARAARLVKAKAK